MWLIRTNNLERTYFTFPDVPPYVALSHTWGREEITFEQFSDLRKARSKAGFTKIEKTCQLARANGIDYAWIDTCCIQQSSSTELSEAVNSMYRWYQSAKICYAYINDWPSESKWEEIRPLGHDPRGLDLSNFVDTPRWFTRGWTLQELIAPSEVAFYNKHWVEIGHKSDRNMAKNLSRITGISSEILRSCNDSKLQKIPLGQRMSWASYRNTTRPEDIAYCLLGIFQVNMALLYGEGEQAFFRLQEEIIKSTSDFSIFAWEQPHADGRDIRGILSEHPHEFARLQDCAYTESPFWQPPEIAMTNRGLRMHTSLLYDSDSQTEADTSQDCFLFLGCSVKRNSQLLSLSMVGDVFFRSDRIRKHQHGKLKYGKRSTIYIARHWNQSANSASRKERENGFRLISYAPEGWESRPIASWPLGSFFPNSGAVSMRDAEQMTGYVKFAFSKSRDRAKPTNGNSATVPGSAERSRKDFMFFYHLKKDKLVTRLVQGSGLEKFESRLSEIEKWDPENAYQEYLKYCDRIVETTSKEIWLKTGSSNEGTRLYVELQELGSRPVIVLNFRKDKKN